LLIVIYRMSKSKKNNKKVKEIEDPEVKELFSDDEDRPYSEIALLPKYNNDKPEYVREQEYKNIYNTESSIIPQLKHLDSFLKQPGCLNPKKGDSATNIVNLYTGTCHIVKDPYIPEFFELLEKCRRLKLKTRMYEIQQKYSGIMLDFDVYQDMPKCQFTEDIYNNLCRKILSVIVDVVKFINKKEIIHMAITKKPSIKYNDKMGCYKDGFHILIPGIKIKRQVKKLIIKKLIENGILEHYLEDVKPASMRLNKDTPSEKDYSINDTLDQNSAHVPVFFLGSITKPEAEPYELKYIFEMSVNLARGDIDSKLKTFDANINLCYELSLNWEVCDGVIKKMDYEVNDKYRSDEIFKNEDPDPAPITEEKSGKVIEIRKMLDILAPHRLNNSMRGFDILCILANTSILYKSEAEYYSRKSPTFDLEVFEKDWKKAVMSNKKRGLTLGSLFYFAKQDDPDQFQLIRKNTVYSVLQAMLMAPYKYGKLTHFDVAELLFILLEYKYFTDATEGEKSNAWYEFMTENDNYLPGELYKWYKHKNFSRNFQLFIIRELPKLFIDNLDKLKELIDESVGHLSKYYTTIFKNCSKMVQNLSDVNFVKNVVYASEVIFNKRGNADKMDKDVYIRGVHNGILKLSVEPSGKPLLITGYHMYLISKFSQAIYYPFNPRDPSTKKILYALRTLFLDSEPDSHEFSMYWFATTIDGAAKESMIMLVIGGGSNGKTGWAEIHRGAIGDRCVKMPIEFLTEKKSNVDGATPVLMQLKDASLAVYSESNSHEELNTSRLKLITGLESLAARKLHENTVNFKPKCHHLVTSNYLFDINCTDFGTWRRLFYNPFKITFKDPKHQTYNPRDPTQRIALPEVLKSWAEDQEMQGKYLGIMVWYHYWLHRKYGGAILAVPHKHIEFATKKYEQSQNNITEFLTQKCVKVADSTKSYDLTEELEKYILWYSNKYKSDKVKGLIEEFQNSIIKEYIINTSRGIMIMGHRFLGKNDIPGPGEEYLFKEVYALKEPDDNYGILPETPDEYYDRICREYDEFFEIFNNIPSVDDPLVLPATPNPLIDGIDSNKINCIIGSSGSSGSSGKREADEHNGNSNNLDDEEPVFDMYGNKLPSGTKINKLYEPDIVKQPKKKYNNNNSNQEDYRDYKDYGDYGNHGDYDLSGYLPINSNI